MNFEWKNRKTDIGEKKIECLDAETREIVGYVWWFRAIGASEDDVNWSAWLRQKKLGEYETQEAARKSVELAASSPPSQLRTT